MYLITSTVFSSLFCNSLHCTLYWTYLSILLILFFFIILFSIFANSLCIFLSYKFCTIYPTISSIFLFLLQIFLNIHSFMTLFFFYLFGRCIMIPLMALFIIVVVTIRYYWARSPYADVWGKGRDWGTETNRVRERERARGATSVNRIERNLDLGLRF